MKTIYLVRHAESTTNVGDFVIGSTAPLTDKGRAQAHVLLERVLKLPIEVIVHTSFARSIETAEILNGRLKLPFVLCNLFSERRHASHVKGLLKNDPVRLAYEEYFWGSQFNDPAYRHFDAENFADLKERAGQAFSFLEECSEENILVVGHGIFSRILLAYLIHGESLSSIVCQQVMCSTRLANCAITVFTHDQRKPTEYGGPWELAVWNDRAHLG